jgi:dTDP-4-amino-4,6-dideoxygalactose transaminase
MQVPFVDLKAQYRAIQKDVLTTLLETLDGMELTLGPNVRAFETEFAAFCRARHAIGVGSGTDALSLALRACGIRRGDEVITVALSSIGTAAAIVQLGAVPVFVDVDAATYTLDPSLLDAAVGPRTRAIVPVHLYGQMAHMDAIMRVAQRHGLVVVEDASHAHGAEDRGRPAGSVGDAAAFGLGVSASPGAYGDAGAVTTNSRAIAEEVRLLRDYDAAAECQHKEMGVSSRLDEVQAAILRVKLQSQQAWMERRHVHAASYGRLLSLPNVQLPRPRPRTSHAYQYYVVQVDDRDRVRQALVDRGVAAQVHYPVPLHRQPAAADVSRVSGDLRVTDSVAARVLSLPIYPELEPQQLAYVASCLEEACALVPV